MHLYSKDSKPCFISFFISRFKGDVEVTKEPSLAERHRIIKLENKFIIDKTNEQDAGTYKCKAGEASKDIIVLGKTIII
jgi:hypothetical protein